MWYPPDFRVLYDLKVLPIFDHAHPIVIKLTLAFLNLYQNAQKSAHFINSLSWDIADFRVSWSKRPLAFLTTTTQKKTFQPDLLRNRDKKPKVMSNNAAQHVLRWLNTAFSKLFVFNDSYVLFYFFPEVKIKIQSCHFYFHW